MNTLHPSLIMFIAAVLIPFLPKTLHNLVVFLAPLLCLKSIWSLAVNSQITAHFAGFDLSPLTVHPYSLIFATAFAIITFAGGVFAMGKNSTTEMASAYAYAGCAIGITFAGDLITLFLLMESMVIFSAIIISCGGTEKSGAAALRYTFMQLLGGAIMLAGIAAHYSTTGDISIPHYSVLWSDFSSPLGMEKIAAWAMLVGLMIELAAPPFSAWIADSYPESSPTGAVFLSAFTTKSAVFVLLTIFAGNSLLVGIGLFMIFYGIVMAVLENDIRRILSYSIVNQGGFMVVGIGTGSDLALYGAAAHAFCCIMYNGLLMMSAGSVIHMTGKNKCTELGGIFSSMKFTAICGIIGALAISAFPWTSGFISKSLTIEAALIGNMKFVWFALLAASAGVFLHAGIKFPWFIFFHSDSGLRPKEAPFGMRFGMFILVVMCIAPGIYPEYVYSMLPGAVDYVPYTPAHIISQIELLMFAGLAFLLLLPWLERTNTTTLDFDFFYRVVAKNILQLLEDMAIKLHKHYYRLFTSCAKSSLNILVSMYGNNGKLAKNISIGNTALYAAGLLGIFLMIYFLIG